MKKKGVITLAAIVFIVAVSSLVHGFTITQITNDGVRDEQPDISQWAGHLACIIGSQL